MRKRIAKRITDMTYDELESLPKKITGIKIISNNINFDAWCLNYYNHYRSFDKKCWKDHRKTQYRTN